ncbi:MAG TPA: hypothetical protein VFN56_00385 [Candidatus Saccharimonadales bacterium]|nr:hypothetical protein [Candidatus Saccharimonadales bacterium]
MPAFLEEGLFCSLETYERRSKVRIQQLGSLTVGSAFMGMFKLASSTYEAAKKPVLIAEPIRKRRSLYSVTFDICDDDLVPEIRTDETFDGEGFMRPSKTVIMREWGKKRPDYAIVEAYLIKPLEHVIGLVQSVEQSRPEHTLGASPRLQEFEEPFR